MPATLVFDIETIPDVASGRRLYDMGNLNDAEVAQALYKLSRQEQATDFLRHHLHKIVAISLILYQPPQIKVWSLGDANSSEAELIQRFYDGIEKFSPSLVSWNGCGFDLPVLHYRSLVHGISAPRYWDTGENDNSFKYNNYLNRYHARHLDLMDVLSSYQPRAFAKLEDLALLLGLPGKMGMHGSLVWEYFQQGDIESIRNYCETDVLNTFIIYLRFEMLRGNLSQLAYAEICLTLKHQLSLDEKPHLREFSLQWQHPLLP